jgi:hypothetical protein
LSVSSVILTVYLSPSNKKCIVYSQTKKDIEKLHKLY